MSEVEPDQLLDAESFKSIADLAYKECGLQLVAEKAPMIQSRLRNRLRVLGIQDFRKYSEHVCSGNGSAERRHMISALTTNVSHFFREMHHFDFLREKIAPSLMNKIKSGQRIRIWSAGCSNGQEAYSVAIVFHELIPELNDLDFRILGTDIDPNVVGFANRAKYPERMVTGIPDTLLKKYFKNDGKFPDAHFTANPNIKSTVTFRELNLLADWPMKQQFEVVFCRNVVIYFDGETQARLWPRFRSVLSDNGHLFLGHSERIIAAEQAGFINCGPTTYQPVSKNSLVGMS